jgi:hypothetical protein
MPAVDNSTHFLNVLVFRQYWVEKPSNMIKFLTKLRT